LVTDGFDLSLPVKPVSPTRIRDRFPLSPRVRSFKTILEKLDPRPDVETLPAPKPPGERSMSLTKKRRR
jgi:hypothetical protein